jgi:hypothetical protein
MPTRSGKFQVVRELVDGRGLVPQFVVQSQLLRFLTRNNIKSGQFLKDECSIEGQTHD